MITIDQYFELKIKPDLTTERKKVLWLKLF